MSEQPHEPESQAEAGSSPESGAPAGPEQQASLPLDLDPQAEDTEQVEELVNAATEALAVGSGARALMLARQATEAAPHLPRVWALLGMVAEEAGEPAEALEAYRRADELEPGRPGLAERIEALEAHAVAHPPPEHDEQPLPGATSRLERCAPALLAVSVALLILALGLAVILRSHRAASLEASYKAAMEQGTKYMALQDYNRAEAAFTDALRLRPEDPEAVAWLKRAQDGRQQYAQLKRWEYTTLGGRFPGVTGENPLTPAKILPTAERQAQEAQARAAAQAGASGQGGSSSPRRYTWAGATSTDWRPTGDTGQFPSPRQEVGTGFFPEPTGAGVEYRPGATGTTGAQTAGTAQQPSGAATAQPVVTGPILEPERAPTGHLRITVGEPHPSPAAARPAGPQADQVRQQADEARRAGRGGEAGKLYQQAADLYQAEARADPQARAVKQAGADYCRRAGEQCE